MDYKQNYHIYGKGGVFFGISKENGQPVFGGGSIFYAPVFWERTKNEMENIIEYFKEKCPGYSFIAKRLKEAEND